MCDSSHKFHALQLSLSSLPVPDKSCQKLYHFCSSPSSLPPLNYLSREQMLLYVSLLKLFYSTARLIVFKSNILAGLQAQQTSTEYKWLVG